jgi:hypothetical protein
MEAPMALLQDRLAYLHKQLLSRTAFCERSVNQPAATIRGNHRERLLLLLLLLRVVQVLLVLLVLLVPCHIRMLAIQLHSRRILAGSRPTLRRESKGTNGVFPLLEGGGSKLMYSRRWTSLHKGTTTW